MGRHLSLGEDVAFGCSDNQPTLGPKGGGLDMLETQRLADVVWCRIRIGRLKDEDVVFRWSCIGIPSHVEIAEVEAPNVAAANHVHNCVFGEFRAAGHRDHLRLLLVGREMEDVGVLVRAGRRRRKSGYMFANEPVDRPRTREHQRIR